VDAPHAPATPLPEGLLAAAAGEGAEASEASIKQDKNKDLMS